MAAPTGPLEACSHLEAFSNVPELSYALGILIGICKFPSKKIIPARNPKQCVRSVSRKSRDLDALGSREVIVVMK